MRSRTASRRVGQTLVEYGILIALLTVVALAILNVVGRNTSDVYVSTSDSLVTQTFEGSSGSRGGSGGGSGGGRKGNDGPKVQGKYTY